MQIHTGTGGSAGAATIRLRPLQVESLRYEECLAYVRGGEDANDPAKRPIVLHQSSTLDRLVQCLAFLPGSYLVTGYRGVGKTSFVNYALARAHAPLTARTPPRTLVPVHLNLARNYDVEKLLRRLIRQLYVALQQPDPQAALDPGGPANQPIIDLLPPDLWQDLRRAYVKTSGKISEAQGTAVTHGLAERLVDELTRSHELGSEVSSPGVPGAPGAKVSTKSTWAHKQTVERSSSYQQASDLRHSLEYFTYDDEIAQAELSDLILRMTDVINVERQEQQQVPRPKPRGFHRIWGWLTRRTLQQWLSWKDADYGFTTELVAGEPTQRTLVPVFIFDELDKVPYDEAVGILKSLKELFLSGRATFIFIAGWEFASGWLAPDAADSDLFRNVFSDIFYIPLYRDEEIADLVGQLVADQTATPSLDRVLMEHLMLHAGGSPRECLRRLLPFVSWRNNEAFIDLASDEPRYGRTQPVVARVNGAISSTLPPQIRDDLRRQVYTWLVRAESEGTFVRVALFDARARDTPTAQAVDPGGAMPAVTAARANGTVRSGLWGRQIEQLFEHFITEMIAAGVFLANPLDDTFTYNTDFSLGVWARNTESTSVLSPESRTVQLEGSAIGSGSASAGVTVTPITTNDSAVDKRDGTFSLPRRQHLFVGREAQLRVVRQAAESSIGIIQIFGPAGMGKSSLAFEAASRLQDRYSNGVLWIDCDMQTPESVDQELAAHAGAAAGATARGGINPVWLEGRLVVLDEAERWSSDAVRRVTFAAAATNVNQNCLVILTTRVRLEVPGTLINLEPLTGSEALDLLRSSLGDRWVDAEPADAQQVAEATGGLPLAISLLADGARAAGQTAAELANEVAGAPRRWMDSDTPFGKFLESSIEQLSDVQLKCVEAAAVFEHKFDAVAVAYVLAAEVGDDQVKAILQELEQQALVSRASPPAYTLHSLVRAYVRARMPADRLRALRSRHRHYVLQAARQVVEGAPR